MRKKTVWLLAAVMAASAGSSVFGSGFSIYEQSAKASGLAGAWVAQADDAAANWYNPATLVRQEGMQLQFGFNLITIGSDTTFTSSDPAFGLPAAVEFETVQNDSFPPHLYFAQNINDRVAWGVGINTPFGLVTEWKDRPVTFSSRKAELVTVLVNPNLAFRLDDSWSMAVGLDYLFADVSNFSRDVDQSALLGQAPGTTVGRSNLTGDGSDWGFNAAVHYDTGKLAWGLTLRGELSPKIEGDIAFSGIAAPIAALFPNGPGSTTIDLPATAATGIAFDAGDDWVVEFDVAWAGWSSFERLSIDLQNETAIDPDGPGPLPLTPVVADILLREDWDDTMSFRLGATWSASERHAWRFGAVFDQNPIPTDTIRPSIPDADRWSVTVGYGYRGKSFEIDGYYMPLFFKDRDAVGNASEGVIDGTYESFVHLLGATVNFRF